jgi:YHS domain-containing protein
MKTLLTTALLLLTLAACSTSEQVQISTKAKPYPLKTCLVTGNDLDSMGGAIDKIYNGQEIQFCCEPCVKKFEAHQAKYLAKLR